MNKLKKIGSYKQLTISTRWDVSNHMDASDVPTAAVKSIKLNSLTSLRFVAGVLVAIGHVGGMSSSPSIRNGAHHSAVGVSFFFTLSGFVLTWSASSGAWQFYRRRFARIFPMHALTWTIAVLLGLLGLVEAGGHTAQGYALILVQAWTPDLGIEFAGNISSWTLSDEAFFYLLFPLVAWVVAKLSAKMQWAGLAAATAFVVIVLPVLTGSDYLLYTFPPVRLLEFTCGVLLACRMKDGWRCRVGVGFASVLAVASIVLVAFVPRAFQFTAVTLIPFEILISACATMDLSRRSGLLQQTWLIRLGAWSFSLYLIHNLVVDVVLSITGYLSLGFLLPVACFVIAVSIGLSGIAYRWVERPAESRLRGRASKRV